MPHASFVPFSAQTRMSGVDIDQDGSGSRRIRKGAAAAVLTWVRQHGGPPAHDVGRTVDAISATGGTRRIPDGARVRIDGNTGLVTVLELPRN